MRYSATFLFLLLLLISIPAFSQDEATLKVELAKAKEDTVKLQLLSDLHWATVYINKAAARQYATRELNLAFRVKSTKWTAQAYNDLGISEQLDNHLEKSLELHQKALKLRTSLGDVAGMGSSQLKVGMMYYQLNQLDKALEAEQKALILLRKVQNKQGEAYALNNICGVLNDQKQYGNLRKYALESYAICKEIDDMQGMANALNYLGMELENRNHTREAEEKYKESLEMVTSLRDTNRMANLLNNLGHLHRNTNQKLTLSYYEESLRLLLAHSVQDTDNIIGCLANVASQYNIRKDFKKAIRLSRAAMLLSEQARMDRYLSQLYRQLSDIFAQTGEADSALKYSAAFHEQVEKKFSADMAANFSKLQTQFEIDLREQQKATLARENELKAQKLIRYQILVSSLVVILVLVVWVFWLIRNRQKIIQKRQLDEQRWQQQEARTKAVIEAEERERQRIARELHDGVGQQLSAARLHLSALEGTFDSTQSQEESLLSNAISMMDDAVKEVRSVAHTMLANALLKQGLAGAVRDFIQKINSSGLIRIELEISGLDRNLDPTLESMLFRIIQEIMSNVIRHSGANQVTIQLHRHETELVLMVEDNGVGFDVSAVSNGAGMQNMKSRVAYINGSFEVDSSTGKGTTISVEVKLD